MTYEHIKTQLIQAIATEMGLAPDEIKETDTFFNLGMDSVSCIFVMERLENTLKLELNAIYFWDYPDIKSFSEFLTTLPANP